MYVIYKGASGAVAGVNVTGNNPEMSDAEALQHYIENGLLADLPWQDWFEPTHECTFYDPDALDIDWGTKTATLNQARVREVEGKAKRAHRDYLLRQTDWTQYSDIPQETKDKWAPYRQALRDITLQEGFPFDVVFPTPPL